jgi:methyltransferase family protein
MEGMKSMAKVEVSLKKSLASAVFPKYSEILDKLNWNALWLDTLRSAGTVPIFRNPQALYSFINEKHFESGADPFDYLEFGVYKGDSLRMWTNLNKNPSSRLFGFDSFEGLPENWVASKPKGTFSTGGKTPDIGDSRVDFVVGLFQHSLSNFLSSYEPRNRLLIHNDSDLFSSTLYTLAILNPIIQPGTLIIFDEFNVVLDEYRALTSYASAFMRNYKIIAATDGFTQTAIEIT